MNPSAPLAPDMAALETDPEAVDRLIARVLANPRFGRLRFIEDVTEDPS